MRLYDAGQHYVRTLGTLLFNMITHMREPMDNSYTYKYGDELGKNCPKCPNVDQHYIVEVSEVSQEVSHAAGGAA